jgi:uncharacterized membrane protein
MKTLSVTLIVVMLLGAVGCSRSTSEGPEATTPGTRHTTARPVMEAETETETKKPIAGEADNTFGLTVPFEAITLTQGEEEPVLIGIDRGQNFAEQVAIQVSGLPTGVTVEADEPVIEPGSTDVTLTLKAADDAALGDFTAKLTGETASSGADFSKEFTITVAEK